MSARAHGSSGSPVWDKPAAACLSSRIPYGTSVTPERLAQIGRFRSRVAGSSGFVRCACATTTSSLGSNSSLEELARAVDPAMRNEIVAAGKRHGFQYVTLDLGGYRTGSHNEVITGKSLRVI